MAKKTSPDHAFTKGFQIDGNANVVIIGSANAVESQRHGYLETLLSAAHPTQRFAIRNMAWPADTVYQQQRPRNFFGTAKPSYGEADRRKPLAVATDLRMLVTEHLLDDAGSSYPQKPVSLGEPSDGEGAVFTAGAFRLRWPAAVQGRGA